MSTQEKGMISMEVQLISEIDLIFEKAHLEGRNTLCEFEIYEILNLIGIQTPNYLVVKEPEEVSKKFLADFGQDLVVKIVSPDIAHKQKLGGVKILKNWGLAELKTSIAEMETEVLSHFPTGSQPKIQGFLIAEFLEYTPALGNEIMIGCREDEEFGPVILVSKGGDDAEFFAQHYDPANLILPPLTYEQCLAFVSKLHIAQKFREQGKNAHIEFIADALMKVAQLTSHYSSISVAESKYRLQSLDINPLVVTSDDRFVAIDGFAEFSIVEESDSLPAINTENLETFFRPKTVAVVGVSADLSRPSVARVIANLLHKIGQKNLYLVNLRGGNTLINGEEYRLYKSFHEIEEPVDLVVYVAPLGSTAQFVKELGNNTKSVIIISGLPTNLEYSDFVKQMDKVKPKDLRILGPNCMGIFFAPDRRSQGVNTLFIEEEKLGLKFSPNSNTALLTQSGALSLTSIDAMQNSKIFKAIVSFGNQYDVKITDLMAYFATDPSIDLIALYIEGLAFGEGRLFFKLAKKIEKPILVYKSGKTETGAKAAASHTEAMSGDYEVFRAASLQGGVILAEKLEDYYDYLRVFSLLAKKKPLGNRVAGVVNAGFESTIAGDELKNLITASLQPETIEKLRRIDVHNLVDLSSALLDITPMANDQIYADYVETVLQDDNVDCVFIGIVPHSNAIKSAPAVAADPDGLANRLIQLSRKYKKPLVVSVNGARYYDKFVELLEEGGLPVYRNIRAAVHSLDTFVSYHLKLK